MPVPLCGVGPQGAFSPPGCRLDAGGRAVMRAWTPRGRAVTIWCFGTLGGALLSLSDLPRDERPRERLAHLGAAALSEPRAAGRSPRHRGPRGLRPRRGGGAAGLGPPRARRRARSTSWSGCAASAGPRPRGSWPRSSWAPGWPPTAAPTAPALAVPGRGRALPPAALLVAAGRDVRPARPRRAAPPAARGRGLGRLPDREPRPPARGLPGGGRLARRGARPLPQPPLGRPGALGRGPRPHAAARRGGLAHGHRGARPPGARARAAT